MAMPKFEQPNNSSTESNDSKKRSKINGGKSIEPIINLIPSEGVSELLDLRTKEERLMDERIERVRKKMGKPPLGLRARYPITPDTPKPDTPKVEEVKSNTPRPRVIKHRPVQDTRRTSPNEVIEYDDQGNLINYLKPLIKKRNRLLKRPTKKPVVVPGRPLKPAIKKKRWGNNKYDPELQEEARQYGFVGDPNERRGIAYRETEMLNTADRAKTETARKKKQQEAWDAMQAQIKSQPPEDLPVEDEHEPFTFNTDFGGIVEPKVEELPETESEEVDISEPEEMDYDEESSLTPEYIPPSSTRRSTQSVKGAKVPSHLPEIEVVESNPNQQEADWVEVLRIGNQNRSDRQREAEFVLEAERRAVDPQGLDQPIIKGTPEGDAFEASRAKEKELEAPEIPSPVSKPTPTPEVKPAVEIDEDFSRMMGEKPVGEEAKQSAWKRFKEVSAQKLVDTKDWSVERLKGMATFGIGELVKGEQLRRGVGEVVKGARKDVNLIEREKDLTYDEASEEAARMQNLLNNFSEEEKATLESFKDSPHKVALYSGVYENLSKQVSAPKIERNKEIERQMIEDAKAKLKQRFEGKTTYSGKAILSDEKLAAIEAELHNVITAARYTQIDRDITNYYKKNIRQHLDPEWYKRYVAGGVEMALWGAGAALLWTSSPKIISYWGGRAAKKVVKTGAKAALGNKGSLVPDGKVKEFLGNFFGGIGGKRADPEWIAANKPGVEIAFDDNLEIEEEILPAGGNIWNTVKEFLVAHNVENPTDAQILEASKEVAKQNDIAVKEWGIKGSISDRQLRPGKVISLKGLGAKAAIWAGKKAIKTAANIAMES